MPRVFPFHNQFKSKDLASIINWNFLEFATKYSKFLTSVFSFIVFFSFIFPFFFPINLNFVNLTNFIYYQTCLLSFFEEECRKSKIKEIKFLSLKMEFLLMNFFHFITEKFPSDHKSPQF